MTSVDDTETKPSPEQDNAPPASAADRIRETAGAAGARAGEAYAAARERTKAAYDSARDRAADAYDATRKGVDSNPTAAVLGGLAIGVILATVLPKTRRETELLGDLGQRLNERAREAATSAKQAGLVKLDEFGVNAAKDKLLNLAGVKASDTKR